MKIALYLYRIKDQTFKKVWFHEWEGNKPWFSNQEVAKKYKDALSANADIDRLRKAKSNTTKTLNIHLEDDNFSLIEDNSYSKECSGMAMNKTILKIVEGE